MSPTRTSTASKLVQCLFDHRLIPVPVGAVDKAGNVTRRYRNRELKSGVFLSDVGPYCGRNCFANYCAD